MRLMLDTNAYSAWKRGDEAVAALIRGAEELLFSSVVAGELLYGFRRGTRYERNLAELQAFLEHDRVTFVPVSLVTADRFGRTAAALHAKGAVIPSNDLWIAAQALEVGADLASYDRHFASVDGLALVIPADGQPRSAPSASPARGRLHRRS